MDTDDLSTESYQAVLGTAGKFHGDLALQFGLLASGCEDDDDFLHQSELLIKEWLQEKDLQYVIDDVFFDNPPHQTAFRKRLQKILDKISVVKQMPMEKRNFEF